MPVYRYLEQSPRIAEGAFVAPTAAVIGDVEIGEGASIWYGTVVRGDVFHIRIGARTNIQDNSVLHVTNGRHATIVGAEVTVGHRVILHGCTIEDGCLVGMGAIVMDRAVVGRGALVGAGALVTEGTKIPPGWLALGAPAKPVRELREAEIQQIAWSPGHYVQLGQEHAKSIGRGY